MRKLYAPLALGALMCLSVMPALAQSVNFTNLGPNPIPLGGTFTVSAIVVDPLPSATPMWAAIPFVSPGLVFSTGAGAGVDVQYVFTTPGQFAPVGAPGMFVPGNQLWNGGADLKVLTSAPHIVQGTTYTVTGNVLTSHGPVANTFQFTVGTPEFGSVFSLGGLLMAGGAGIWMQRRRRNGKGTTEAK